MSAMRGQAPMPDFPHLDDEPTDRVDRMIRRRRSDEETEKLRHMWRLTVEETFVQEKLKVLPQILGPEPETGQEWADRGLRGLEIAMVEGSGISPTAAKAYEEACTKRAKWADPAKFGDKLQLPNGADGKPLGMIAIQFVSAPAVEREVNSAVADLPKP